MDLLKDEIKKWPRIGMVKEDESQIMYYQAKPKEHKVDGYGFKKIHEFDFTYGDIDKDVERLTKEGLVIEFKDESVHSSITNKDKDHQEKGKRNKTTVMFPVNMEDTQFEVRG